MASRLSSLSISIPQQPKTARLQNACHFVEGRSRWSPSKKRTIKTKALEIDFSDPNFLLGAMGAVVGLAVGIGFPVFMISRDKADEERVDALRELNKQTFEATGEYLSKEELTKMRTPRWTDRREFKDDD